MSDPTTEAGRDMLAHCVQYSPLDADKTVTGEKIAAIEAEARADADAESELLRGALRAVIFYLDQPQVQGFAALRVLQDALREQEQRP